jgi:uncharacterized damage-inducible protein DinB
MTQNQLLIADYQHEMVNTRKLLERVPLEKSDWRPHPKSMPLGELALHLADMPTWIGYTLNHSELDFSKGYSPPKLPADQAALVALMDKNVEQGIKDLEKATDGTYAEPWTLRNGEHIYFTLPKLTVLKNFVFNHNIHHRAQLGVYLRLLDVPIPGMYGPSADDKSM